MGNSVAKEKALEKARDALTREENEKLLMLLRTTGHAPSRKMLENDE